MKILFYFVVLCLGLIIFFFFYSDPSFLKETISNLRQEETQITEAKTLSVMTGGNEYAVVYYLASPEQISLIPNLESRLTAPNAKVEYNCKLITSAGFYNKEDEYIGLLVNEGETISSSQTSTLFNGYFSTDGRVARISKAEPINPSLALQSGPLAFYDGKKISLTSETGEFARRILVATTREGVTFLAIYNKNSVLLGPSLTELPDVIQKVNEVENLGLISALNLDGGTASTFITNSANLPEVVHSGSFFCVK